MVRREKIELTLILILALAVWLSDALPKQVSIGTLTLWLAGLLLGQGLLRDLWILISSKSDSKAGLQKTTQCLCFESTIGLTGIILGTLFLISGFDQVISVNEKYWSILVLLTTGVGFLIKDYILLWSPLRLRRETNHMNIIFSWRSSK